MITTILVAAAVWLALAGASAAVLTLAHHRARTRLRAARAAGTDRHIHDALDLWARDQETTR